MQTKGTATEGPWRFEMLTGHLHILAGSNPAQPILCVAELDGETKVQDANASLIVKAVNAHEGLLAMLSEWIAPYAGYHDVSGLTRKTRALLTDIEREK